MAETTQVDVETTVEDAEMPPLDFRTAALRAHAHVEAAQAEAREARRLADIEARRMEQDRQDLLRHELAEAAEQAFAVRLAPGWRVALHVDPSALTADAQSVRVRFVVDRIEIRGECPKNGSNDPAIHGPINWHFTYIGRRFEDLAGLGRLLAEDAAQHSRDTR